MKVFTLFLILIFAFDAAFACTCSITNEAETVKALKNRNAVFEGRVVSINPPQEFVYPVNSFVDIEFRVEKSWKGIDSGKILIRTYQKTSSCNINFEVGEMAIIVADGEPLQTDLCMRGNIAASKFSEIFGVPKVFDNIESQEMPQQPQISESFCSKFWNKIVSFFS